jgi:hypothetical protein
MDSQTSIRHGKRKADSLHDSFKDKRSRINRDSLFYLVNFGQSNVISKATRKEPLIAYNELSSALKFMSAYSTAHNLVVELLHQKNPKIQTSTFSLRKSDNPLHTTYVLVSSSDKRVIFTLSIVTTDKMPQIAHLDPIEVIKSNKQLQFLMENFNCHCGVSFLLAASQASTSH